VIGWQKHFRFQLSVLSFSSVRLTIVVKIASSSKVGLTRFDGHPERAGRGFMV
jgi:hypothetical protein